MKKNLLTFLTVLLFCFGARAIPLGNPAMTTNNQVVSYPIQFGVLSNGVFIPYQIDSTNTFNWLDNAGNTMSFSNGVLTVQNINVLGGGTNFTAITVTNLPTLRNTLPLQILTNYTVTAADLTGMMKSNFVYRMVTIAGNL